MAGDPWADFLKHDRLGHTFRRLARVGFYLHLIRAALNWTLHVAARNRHSRSDFGVGSRFGPLSLESVSGVTPNWAQTPISRISCHGAIMFIVLCALAVSYQRLFTSELRCC